MSDTASKKPRLESEPDGGLRELAESARRQRELIRQKIKKLNHPSISFSEDVVPPSEDVILPPNPIIQLSNPTFSTKLPFPFVGYAVPGRFDVALGDNSRNWFYMGRELFAVLTDRFERFCQDPRRDSLIVYGTRGYGKSHLLAALVCLLAAEKTKVVYVPDCRAFMKKPVSYMRAAMLFAWADDESKQQTIMTLQTLEEIDKFLAKQSEVVFVIDQLNALERKKDDDESTASEKTRLHRWLQGLVMEAKAILSSSANNHSILKGWSRPDNSEILHVYGGLTEVSLRKNNSFVNWDSSNYDLEGNGTVVEADGKCRTRRIHERKSRRLHRLYPIVLRELRREPQNRSEHRLFRHNLLRSQNI